MTKVKFILSSISSDSRFWSVNRTSVYENSELCLWKYKIVGEICNNSPNGLFGLNVYKTFESCW